MILLPADLNWRSSGAVHRQISQFYCATSTAPPIRKTACGAVAASMFPVVCAEKWRSTGAVVAQWRSRLFVWLFTSHERVHAHER